MTGLHIMCCGEAQRRRDGVRCDEWLLGDHRQALGSVRSQAGCAKGLRRPPLRSWHHILQHAECVSCRSVLGGLRRQSRQRRRKPRCDNRLLDRRFASESNLRGRGWLLARSTRELRQALRHERACRGLLRRLRADGWLNEGEPEEKSRADDRASDCDDAPKNGERLGLDGEEPAWPSPAALCKPLGEGVVPLKRRRELTPAGGCCGDIESGDSTMRRGARRGGVWCRGGESIGDREAVGDGVSA